MKILKEKSRSYKGTDYYKYKVNLPEVKLHAAKLKEGDELEVITGHESITLRKKTKKEA